MKKRKKLTSKQKKIARLAGNKNKMPIIIVDGKKNIPKRKKIKP